MLSNSPMRPRRRSGYSIQVRQIRSGTRRLRFSRNRIIVLRPTPNMTIAMIAIAIIAQPPDSQIWSACWQELFSFGGELLHLELSPR
jgi:hypothetical protein